MKEKVLIPLVASLLLASAGATGAIAASNNKDAAGTVNVMTKPAIAIETPTIDSEIEHNSGAIAVSEDKQKLIYSLQIENGDEYMDTTFRIKNNSIEPLVAAITVKPKPVIKGTEINFAGENVVRIAQDKWLVGSIVSDNIETVEVQIDVSPTAELGLKTFEINVAPTEFKVFKIAA